MANAKSVIRDIDLQNVTINLNKNKSIISDFNGFNKNTGVWFNGVLSNLYCNSDKAADDIITIDNDVYKIIDNALYKNDVLVKDYTNINKVRTEILGNIDDNVLAYTPVVHIYYEGDSVYVKSGDTIIPAGSYNPNTIPYIIIDKAADTWCVIYGNYIICKGMTEAKQLGVSPTAALYSATKSKWYYVKIDKKDHFHLFGDKVSLVSVTDNEVVTLDLSAGILDGAVTISGWMQRYKAFQVDSRTVFLNIQGLNVADNPSVTLNKSVKTFKYLKGYFIEDVSARPHYSNEGDAIDMSVVPSDATLYVQPYNAWDKLASTETKFLSYNSFIIVPYSTVAFEAGDTNPDVPGGHPDYAVSKSSVDGTAEYLLESTSNSDEFITLTGSTAGPAKKVASLDADSFEVKNIGEANVPKLLGLFNDNYSPEWLSTKAFNFKLIYNKDALVGISKDGSIIVPWNDVDENTLTMTENDIYYYSLNSNTWVHVNVSTESRLEAIKVGKNLLLNSVVDNCYRNDKEFTYSVDNTLADFTISKPRLGFLNVYYMYVLTYMKLDDSTNTDSKIKNVERGNRWLSYILEVTKNTEKYYISITGENDGPIWSATQLGNYPKAATNFRKEGWQYTLSPSYDTKTIDYSYYFNNMELKNKADIDAYTSETGSVLSYFKSWYAGSAKYNNKLADVEKSMTEPTYYNLSPNVDIMTYIDGFNTISLLKVGNNTLQLLVKESELLLVYNILSNVNNVSEYFVLQGQQYGIINNYINKVDMVNGQVVSQTPITSVEGLKFLGNTDKQAFFFSQMNKTIQYFAADNTLEFLMDATEIDNNTTTVFAKQTNDIFLLLNDKVVVFTNGGSMYEMLTRAEYITFGDNSWSDGNKTWSYYKTDTEQERVPIELETLWFGDTTTRRLMNVDCIYIELYDDNYMPGKFEISFDGLVNNTASTKKQVFNVKSSDYDRVTKTVYLRYQPAFQNCTAFKLNIKSDLAIKRIAIGYTSEGIPLISKNNI